MIRNPPSIQRIRKSHAGTAETKILLQHIDNLVAQLERFENLDLTDAQIMEVAGPATSEIGGVDLWELGAKDLTRLARAILAAAMKARSEA